MFHKIDIHSDGACSGNPGPGGWCAIVTAPAFTNVHKEISGYEPNTTNNRMELKAAIEGVRYVRDNTHNVSLDITLFSDSQYVTKGIAEWLPNWIKKNFKDVKNPELWKEYIEVSKGLNIKTVWVKGHNGDKFNEMCDTIAQRCAKSN